MKKSEFISLVKISLNGGIPPAKNERKFHDKVIESQVSLAFNEIVSMIKEPSVLDAFAAVYRNVEVKRDEELGLAYSDLPVSVLTTVNFNGLRMVAPMKDQTNVFYIRKNNSTAAMNRMSASVLMAFNTVRIEGRRLYYDSINMNVDSVLVKLIAPFDQLDEDDEIEMPGGKDSAVFQMVIQNMQQLAQTPAAYKNDNNSNSK